MAINRTYGPDDFPDAPKNRTMRSKKVTAPKGFSPDDFPSVDMAQVKKNMSLTAHDTPQAPTKQYGTIHNVLAAPYNMLASGLNLAPEAVTGIAHMLGHKDFNAPEIPMDPHNPGLAYGISSVVSGAVPFMGALRGLGAAGKAAEGLGLLEKAAPTLKGIKASIGPDAAKSVGKVANLAKLMGKSAAAGAGTGFVFDSPISQGHLSKEMQDRLSAMKWGGIGGAGGEALGQVLRAGGRGLGALGVREKLSNMIADDIPEAVKKGKVKQPLIGKITNQYLTRLNTARKAYGRVFGDLRNSDLKMRQGDLKNYHSLFYDGKRFRVLKDGKRTLFDPGNPTDYFDPKNAAKVHEMYDSVLNKDDDGFTDMMSKNNYRALKYADKNLFVDPFGKEIDPEHVHHFKSKLGTLIQSKRPETIIDRKLYEDAKDQLGTDLNRFLDKTGHRGAYEGAQQYFKNQIGPFRDIDLFKNKILPHIEEKLDYDPRAGHYNIVSSPNIKDSDIADKFLPGVGEEGTRSLDNLTTLLGGDKALAGKEAQKILFSNHTVGPSDERRLDVPALMKRWKTLKPDQKNFMFNKMEQKTMDTAYQLHDRKMNKTQEKLTNVGCIGWYSSGRGRATHVSVIIDAFHERRACAAYQYAFNGACSKRERSRVRLSIWPKVWGR
jgi:hypothetical protein